MLQTSSRRISEKSAPRMACFFQEEQQDTFHRLGQGLIQFDMVEDFGFVSADETPAVAILLQTQSPFATPDTHESIAVYFI